MEDKVQYRTGHENALVVRGVDELQAIGQQFETSGMFGCTAEGQGMVLAMTCVMDNITPLKFQQTYHIVQGRVTMRADAMLAKYTERGGKYKIKSRTSECAAIIMDKNNQIVEFSFTWEEAKQESFVYRKGGKQLKDNWATNRGKMQMLWARVVSDAVRAVDPGVCSGTYTPEEVSDFGEGGGVIMEGNATEEKTAEVVEVAEIDYNVMPAGKNKGKRWKELPSETLQAVLETDHKIITDKHKEAAEAVLAERAQKAE